MNLKKLRSELRQKSNKSKANVLKSFFKTGPGEYAEGDIFLGITVPVLRAIAKNYRNMGMDEVLKLLRSRFHEERLVVLLILIIKYRKAGLPIKKKIYAAYLAHTKYINNWDLVDVTAKHIIGDYLNDKDRSPLYNLARSESLWERRIAILSTFHFIENNDFEDTLRIAGNLLSDTHDLIHKAVGWMLREVGKRDIKSEERFLKEYYKIMPRTMLRYAIERFPESDRKAYLCGKA